METSMAFAKWRTLRSGRHLIIKSHPAENIATGVCIREPAPMDGGFHQGQRGQFLLTSARRGEARSSSVQGQGTKRGANLEERLFLSPFATPEAIQGDRYR
jgi:hypothetical protein